MVKKTRLAAKIAFEKLLLSILKMRAKIRQHQKIQLTKLLAKLKLKRKKYKMRLYLLRQRLKRLRQQTLSSKRPSLFFQYTKPQPKASYAPTGLSLDEARIIANLKKSKLKH